MSVSIPVPREDLCRRLAGSIQSRGMTLSECAKHVSEATGRSVAKQHVWSALQPKADKYDNLRLDMAVVLLGGAWGIRRIFVEMLPN